MEFLRIGENQLKITLTQEELLFYGMDLSSLNYSSTETRRAFWALLDDAKHATGFDAAATKVSVQVYASRTGGCEMYILREGDTSPDLPSEEGCNQTTRSLPAVESGLTVCPSGPKHFSPGIGAFTCLTDLLSACLALQKSGYDGKSSAWQIQDRYFLHLVGSEDRPHRSKSSAMDATGVIWEFGTPAKDITLPYLAEHGVSICSTDAVGKLSRVAT